MSSIEAKIVTEKKPTTASHPPYFQMIKEALLGVNEKGGSSLYAIAKFMEDKHKSVLPDNFRKMLALQLKNSVTKGKLTKVKASYKLCDQSGKKVKSSAVKKPIESKKHGARATATATIVATKKVKKPTKKAKKMTSKKQPKSVVAKKGRKASV